MDHLSPKNPIMTAFLLIMGLMEPMICTNGKKVDGSGTRILTSAFSQLMTIKCTENPNG
jgi:hypothetical protein